MVYSSLRNSKKVSRMRRDVEEAIVETILKHLPQSLCHGLEEGLIAAGEMAYIESAKHHEGHLPNVIGQARHFRSNEQFSLSLDVAGIEHNPLRGNDIIIGHIGPLLLGRFNTSNHKWNNAKRSSRRLELANHNRWLEKLIQPSLFGGQIDNSHIAVFFVSVFSGSIRVRPEAPLSVEIAVMDTTLSEKLFSEPVSVFLQRYAQPVAQPDLAHVRLKVATKKKQSNQS